MKGIIKGFVVAAMTIAPLAASAQKNINSAIDAFGANTGKYGIWNKVENKDDGGAYCTTYKFKLPKKEEKELDVIRKALYQDMPEAYDVFIKKAGDKSKANRLIAYGDKLDKRLTLGWGSGEDNADKNYIFIWISSNDDADYRYVYGMEWHYEGKNVEGSVTKIYSRDPKKAKSDKVTVINGDAAYDSDGMESFAEDMKSLGKELKELKSLGKLSNIFGGKKQSGSDTIEQKDGRTIMSNGKHTIIINGDGSIDIDDGDGKKMSIDSKGNVTGTKQGTASEDPVQQFGNLRAAYLNNIREGNIDNTTLLTGLANSILDLCKTKGKQMTAAEKQLCIEGLKDMQQQTPDKFIKGIFGVAMDKLNK